MFFFKKITTFLGLLLLCGGITLAKSPKKRLVDLIEGKIQATHNFQELGQHVIAEFIGCESLNDYDNLKSVLQIAAEQAGATLLHVHTHKFSPQGMTGVAVLAESHISVHTWPEFGYAAVDVFTCGQHVQVGKAIDVLSDFFQPQSLNIITLGRGYSPEE